MRIPFTKMHALGNDFVLIDAREETLRQRLSVDAIRRLADRRRGVGFDQLLLLVPAPAEASAGMRVFNADGSQAEQCGNGLRCFGRYIVALGLVSEAEALAGFDVWTGAGMTRLWLLAGDSVRARLGAPQLRPAAVPLTPPVCDPGGGVLATARTYRFEPARDFAGADRQRSAWPALPTQLLDADATGFELSAVSMGNPHAVLRVRDVAAAPVDSLGPALQRCPRFAHSVNVGFMQVLDAHRVRLRVYERGVGETQACGSGACAAVVAGIHRGLLDGSAAVQLPGGELRVAWAGGPSDPVYLEGPATHVFDGVFDDLFDGVFDGRLVS